MLLGFYELIRVGLIAGYGPFFYTIQIFYTKRIIPTLLELLLLLGSIIVNQYTILPITLFLIFAYKYDFLSSIFLRIAATFIVAFPFILMPVMTFGIAAGASYFIYILARSLYRFLTPYNNDWRIQHAFEHPFSDESILTLFISAGIGMSFKSFIPFLVTGGAILGLHPLIRMKNLLSRLIWKEQASTHIVEPPHVVAVQRNSPPSLLPRHAPRIGHRPNLSLEEERIRRQVMQQFLNISVPVWSPPIDSPFQKVLDLLQDSNNDYLLTENNNFFLRDAAEKSNWELVARLLKKPNVAAQAHYGDWLVLRLALQHDRWDIVAKFLKLPILAQKPVTVGQSDIICRLIHKVTTQNQTKIMNQIIHGQLYDLLNVQTKLKFLFFALEHNMHSAIIKILNNRESLDELSFNDFNIIFNKIPNDHIQKISTQCDFFIAYIKEKYTNTPIMINTLNIDHLINSEHLDTLENIALFYKNLFEFLKIKMPHKLHAIIAMQLLDGKNTYLSLSNTRQGANEGAQQATEVIQANQLFETVKNHYQETFNSKKTIEHSPLEAIEREIKTHLLEQILSEARENINKEKDIEASNQIINIIDSNKEALLDGEIFPHWALIEVFNEFFIPDNVSSAQTAWLSYNAHHDVDQNGWKFLVQPTEERIVHSTAESAQAENQAMTNVMASQIIRERVAYYWLAVTDETYPDEDNFRLGNFVGAISTIYQTNGFGQSCCYPGHLTGIAQMGLHHPVAEPITLEKLIEQAIVAPIVQASKDTLEQHPNWSAEDKENFLISMTFMTENNADELFHSNSLSPFDTKMYLAFKEHHSFIIDSAFDEILKNQRYQNRTVSLQEREEIKAGILYKVLAMASNPHIVSSLNDIVLTSRCIKKDITLEEASPFAPNTHKHKLYLMLAKELNKQLLSRSDEKLPTIVDLNKIGGEISKQIIDDIVSGQKPTLALEALHNFGLSVNINEVEYLHLMQNTESSVLPQFNAQRQGENRNVLQSNPSQKNQVTLR